MGRGKGRGGSAAGAGVVGAYAAEREAGADLAKGLTVDRDNGKAIDAASKEIYGKVLSDAELASMAGTVDGASVTISGFPGSHLIEVTWMKGGAIAVWKFTRSGIKNDSFFANQAGGKGLGLRSFSRQVDVARRFGVKEIRTDAARGFDMVGYRVWPKFGYNAPITPEIRRTLPSHLQSAKTVLDLYRTKAGRDAWATHGQSTRMTFDLKSGSRSMKTLAAYKASKAKK